MHDQLSPVADMPNADAPRIQNIALVCLSEDELDEWWNGLDVDIKSDCFIGFSLRAQGQNESHVYVPEIPVAGAVRLSSDAEIRAVASAERVESVHDLVERVEARVAGEAVQG